MKKIKFTLLLLIITMLSACGTEECLSDCDAAGENCMSECGECVEGDDWGYPRIIVPASTHDVSSVPGTVNRDRAAFDPNAVVTDLKFVPGKDTYGNQEVIPVDSGQVLLDAKNIPLVITVDEGSKWTSWFNGIGMPAIGRHPETGKKIYKECAYDVTKGMDIPLSSANDTTRRTARANHNASAEGGINEDLSPTVRWAEEDDASKTFNILDESIYGDDQLEINNFVPCYFKHGMGLYIGLLPDDASGDGRNSIYTYHIPDQRAPGVEHDDFLFDEDNDPKRDGYLIKGMPAIELPGAETRDRLYFKILDRYYNDNAGEYVVKLKEGTRNADSGPLETLANGLLAPVFVLMERLYKGVVNNYNFIQGLRAALVLYMVFYGFSIMIGTIKEHKKDAAMRIIKFALVVQVISPDSWDFFYNNLFSLFVNGITEIAGLLMSPFSNYDPASPWYSMDELLSKIFSISTFRKIGSTLFSNGSGILFLIILYASMIVFLFAVIRALIIYIVGFVVIAVLVVLAPIFITFILFNYTESLFKEWVQQFIAVAIQEIMLFTALGMFAAIIVYFMERNLGYNVCWNIWFKLEMFGEGIFDFRFWMPQIGNDLANIWADANNDGIRETNEYASRYVDLPYFDPVYDKDLIAKYMREKNFLELTDIGVFFALIILMYGFLKFIPDMSDAIKTGFGGDAESASIFPAGGKLLGGMGRALGATLRFGDTANAGFGIGDAYAMKKNWGKDKNDKTRVKRGSLTGLAGHGYNKAKDKFGTFASDKLWSAGKGIKNAALMPVTMPVNAAMRKSGMKGAFDAVEGAFSNGAGDALSRASHHLFGTEYNGLAQHTAAEISKMRTDQAQAVLNSLSGNLRTSEIADLKKLINSNANLSRDQINKVKKALEGQLMGRVDDAGGVLGPDTHDNDEKWLQAHGDAQDAAKRKAEEVEKIRTKAEISRLEGKISALNPDTEAEKIADLQRELNRLK